MSAATAQMRLELVADHIVGNVLRPVEKRFRPHHHAGNAVAALRRLLFDEGLLKGTGMVGGPKTFQRRNLAVFGQHDRRDAGEDRFPIDDHGASAALAEATAIFGRVEAKFVPQHIEQRGIGGGSDFAESAIKRKCEHDILLIDPHRPDLRSSVAPLHGARSAPTSPRSGQSVFCPKRLRR